MAQQHSSQKTVGLVITISALFMILLGLAFYFFYGWFNLDKETAKIATLFCVGVAVFEIVVIKKIVIAAMSKR